MPQSRQPNRGFSASVPDISVLKETCPMGSTTKIAQLEAQIDPAGLPKHVAIIMDGNRRWARKHGLKTMEGHEAGVKAVRKTVEASREIGIKALSLYAFSTENWRRSRTEVTALWRLLGRNVKKELDRLVEGNVRLVVMGRRDGLPAIVRRDIETVEEATVGNSEMILNVALNYGSQQEIVDAAKSVAAAVAEGHISVDDIDTALFGKHLYTADLPDLELLIRTSGEHRISNFMLWQLSYAELVFTRSLWPDFSKSHLLRAVLEFQRRQRRFGGTGTS